MKQSKFSKKSNSTKSTDWEEVEKWYGALVGKEGHYYHKQIILPKLLPLLALNGQSKLLDLACGQGVLARKIPHDVAYLGIDLSPNLIKQAALEKRENHAFVKGDICKPLSIKEKNFTHASIILALQNIEHPEMALKNTAIHLQKNGVLVIVLNHPCFRIPRQTHWEVDETKKLQYRRVDRYLTPLKIPIQAHPGKREASPTTWSFHRPLSFYSLALAESGFVIELIEEWTSDKISTGKAAKMENRARSEFPLFLTLKCKKM